MHATDRSEVEALAEAIVDADFAVADATLDECERTFFLHFSQTAPHSSRHQVELLKETWYARTYAVPQVWADLVVRHVLSIDPPLESLTDPGGVHFAYFDREGTALCLDSPTLETTITVKVSEIDMTLTFTDDIATHRRVSHGIGGWVSSGPLDDSAG